MVWQLNRSGVFNVHSFYKSLLKAPSVFFPWQCIWSVKVPRRVSFFLWTVARGGILTIDNLVKKNLPLVNWCCLCRCEEETVDHLLLHCKFVHTLWSEVFYLFRVQWVMPNTVVSLLPTWWNWLGIHSSNVWNMVPTWLMWLTWKERHARTFEDTKRTVDPLKSLLTKTLFEWSHIWGFTCTSSLLYFINYVSFSLWYICICFFAMSLLSLTHCTFPINKFLLDIYFENLTIRLRVLYVLNTCQILYQIGCYLPFNLETHLLCIILKYKNL